MVTRFISKGKGRNRKSIPITPKKKKGVTVRSVSLEPQAIQKINKKTIKTLNTGTERANFSSSLNKLVISARLKRDEQFTVDDFWIDQRGFLRFTDGGFPQRRFYDMFAKKVQEKQFGKSPNKTVWKVVLEDPSVESGTRTHIITLGRQATEEDVRNQLLRMQENGRFMYHPQDLQFPNLQTIERKKRDEQVITIEGHSTNIPASPDSTEDEDRYVEETVRIGLIKRRQALALIKRSPKGIDQMEIREILGSEALPEIRVLTDIDKTVVEKDGIFKVAKK